MNSFKNDVCGSLGGKEVKLEKGCDGGLVEGVRQKAWMWTS